ALFHSSADRKESTMKSRFRFLTFVLAVIGLAAVAISFASARAGDVLYVGDSGDNTIKAFDVASGAVVWTSDGPQISGLSGPRGIIVRGDELLVVNQNVDLAISGEVLRFDRATGNFLGVRIAASDPGAPFAPFGMVLGAADDLFIGNLQR